MTELLCAVIIFLLFGDYWAYEQIEELEDRISRLEKKTIWK